MPYIAGVEVDQRQNFIQQADTLREMLGASRLIEYSLDIAKELLSSSAGVRLFWPVSGVARFYSKDISPLADFLADYRAELERISLTCSIAVTECSTDFDSDLTTLDRRVRRQKDGKTGAIAVPTAPYFAPCSMIPQLSANSWDLEEAAGRQLRSWQAKQREKFLASRRNRPLFGLRIPNSVFPFQMDQLAPQDSDSYIGILKGDVDGLGRLLGTIRFSQLAKEPELAAIQRKDLPPAVAAAGQFCEALEGTVKRAVHEAYQRLHPLETHRHGEYYPFAHLIVAGDDILVLSRRELALELAGEIAETFGKLAGESPVLQAALRCTGLQQQKLTISFGILFAKAGYPFDASFDLAEELLSSAKHGRKKTGSEAFLDFHWLGDSARPRLEAMRDAQQAYCDDSGAKMSLTTRPWSLNALRGYTLAANKLSKIPRRKVKQLDEIVRLGKEFSELAFTSWWKHLRDKEQDAVREAMTVISWNGEKDRAALWRSANGGYETCFLDLLELSEIIDDKF